MPELPEVEHVVRSLAAPRVRAPVVEVWRSALDLRIGAAWRREHERAHDLLGTRPKTPGRRGKYIIWPFGEQRLLLHLGMSGRCDLVVRGTPEAPHTHLRVEFDDGRSFRFVDPRRFGGFNVAHPAIQDQRPPLVELGPEPLEPEFDGAVLAARLGDSARTLRDGLLDQRVVAGLGNIYVNEALFAAGLHPKIKARRLLPAAWDRLGGAVVEVLRRGIDNGGTTLRDYRDASGEAGRNQATLRVYGRAGFPCRRCRTPLEGFAWGGRSGVFCPSCQKNPGTRWVG